MYRVLVPVDRDTARTESQVEYVTSLADVCDELEVRVLFVNEADYQGAKEREFDDIESATMAVEHLEDAGIPVDGLMREGVVSRNIIDEAEDYDADDIVMAGRDRSGVTKVIMGSVTQDIILASKRPVTVVG